MHIIAFSSGIISGLSVVTTAARCGWTPSSAGNSAMHGMYYMRNRFANTYVNVESSIINWDTRHSLLRGAYAEVG